MFCPVCRTEYVPGISVCSDCGSKLIPELPPSLPDEAPFALIWSGSDSRRREEVRSALEKKGIPVRSIRREDYLIYVPRYSEFEVHVPAPRLEEAKELLDEAGMLDKDWRELEESDVFELPEGEPSQLPDSPFDSENWPAEDANTEAWSGSDHDLAEMIAASLRENGIGSRLDPPESADEEDAESKEGSTIRKVFVLSEDATRAREIVHEIVDATPPN
jgi:hypothetical protein